MPRFISWLCADIAFNPPAGSLVARCPVFLLAFFATVPTYLAFGAHPKRVKKALCIATFVETKLTTFYR